VTVWSDWEGPSTYEKERVGIDLSVSGTTITCKVTVQVSGSVSDSQNMTVSGAISYTQAFTASNSSGTTATVYTKTLTRTGTRGVTYTVTAKVTGIYTGATPSVSGSITVPVVDPSAPGTPTVSAITTTTATAKWADPSDWGGDNTSAFTVQWDDNASFSSPTSADLTGNTKSLTGLATGRTFYVRVRARNGAGAGAWSGTRSFTTPDVPDAPATPTVSDTDAAGFTAAWTTPANNGSGITGYRVQVSTSSTFGSTVLDTTTTSTSRVVSGLDRATTYYVRVLATNGVGSGPWSPVKSVHTLPLPPGAPSLGVPSTITPVGASLSWAAPADNGGSGVTGYQVQTATNSGFTAGVVTRAAAGTALTVSDLFPGTGYWVRVRAQNTMGWGDWSNVRTFTTASPVFYGEASGWTQMRAYLGEGSKWTPVRVMAADPDDSASWVG
jgi:hypothetical protein